MHVPKCTFGSLMSSTLHQSMLINWMLIHHHVTCSYSQCKHNLQPRTAFSQWVTILGYIVQWIFFLFRALCPVAFNPTNGLLPPKGCNFYTLIANSAQDYLLSFICQAIWSNYCFSAYGYSACQNHIFHLLRKPGFAFLFVHNYTNSIDNY